MKKCKFFLKNIFHLAFTTACGGVFLKNSYVFIAKFKIKTCDFIFLRYIKYCITVFLTKNIYFRR